MALTTAADSPWRRARSAPTSACVPGTSRRQRLAEVVQERPTPADLDVGTDLRGDRGGEHGGLDQVLEHVLPVGRAEPQPTQRPDQGRVQPRDARALGGVVAGRVGPLLRPGQGLGVRLLDPLRVDPTVRHERLERDLGDLAALRVEAREHHGVRLVVDEHVHAGQRLEGPDVAALLADDPALHLVRRQRQHGERRLRAGRDGEPLHGRRDDPSGPRLRGPARLRLRAAHLGRRVVLGVRHDPPRELGARVVGRQAADRLELRTRGPFGIGHLLGRRALGLLDDPRARAARPPPRRRRPPGCGARARPTAERSAATSCSRSVSRRSRRSTSASMARPRP